jgi:hypothetical protein
MDVLDMYARCRQGDHDLVEVSRHGYEEHYVVRWCRVCGAVVGDVDYDGRTSPGRSFKMMGPKTVKVVRQFYG